MSPDVLPLRPAEAGTTVAELRFDPSDHARLIDREELAGRLSLGVSTLDRQRAAGKIGPQPIRVGGSVRFRLAEVAAWLATPAPNGELHDSDSWPAVWESIRRRAEK